jgi:hypothetical protein
MSKTSLNLAFILRSKISAYLFLGNLLIINYLIIKIRNNEKFSQPFLRFCITVVFYFL